MEFHLMVISYQKLLMDQEDNNEIKKQFLDANKTKPEPIRQLHSQDAYTSKLYDTCKTCILASYMILARHIY